MINSLKRHSHAVAIAHDRSEVTDKDERILFFFSTTLKRDDAVVRVMRINPGETAWLDIQFAQGRLARIKMVQVAQVEQQLRVARVTRRLQKMPVEALFIIPLAPLPEFRAHEQQFLTGMAPHIAIKGA